MKDTKESSSSRDSEIAYRPIHFRRFTTLAKYNANAKLFGVFAEDAVDHAEDWPIEGDCRDRGC
jgi:hypothetical protein